MSSSYGSPDQATAPEVMLQRHVVSPPASTQVSSTCQRDRCVSFHIAIVANLFSEVRQRFTRLQRVIQKSPDVSDQDGHCFPRSGPGDVIRVCNVWSERAAWVHSSSPHTVRLESGKRKTVTQP
ncbi:hypothetical protein WMY93_022943 [Mugilogobius chulae]|uniref:Uncharacterized protein n=1 Tax=Mugilogobius chulae TaxID=88201 RepID=A0AAW0NCV8_9GOBI